MEKQDKITAEEVLKYKQNSTNHMLHFSGKVSGQKEGAYIHISTVYEAMEEYAALKFPVQEQSKQEVKDKFFKQFLSPHKRLDRMYLYEGEAEEVFTWFEPYLSLPQEQKDKVTGVRDEILDDSIRLLTYDLFCSTLGKDVDVKKEYTEKFIKQLRNLLSSKAVEQKEPDGWVCDDMFSTNKDKCIYLQEYYKLDDDIKPVYFSPPISPNSEQIRTIQEAEHKQGATDKLPKFLYTDNGGLFVGVREHVDVTDMWNEFLRSLIRVGKGEKR